MIAMIARRLDANVECTDPLTPGPLASGLLLGLGADYGPGPDRDAFSWARAFPLHRNPDVDPVSLPDRIMRPVRVAIAIMRCHFMIWPCKNQMFDA